MKVLITLLDKEKEIKRDRKERKGIFILPTHTLHTRLIDLPI